MNKNKRQAIFDKLAEAIPDPKTELNYSSPCELLIAVVLSAQATDKGVNKATAKLFPVANTPETLVALGLLSLKTYINSIGLYNTKAEHIMKLCEQVIRLHAGQVPETRIELEALPGVGRKTANVILNTAFGQPTIAVDTHIFRVANRTKIAIGKNVTIVEQNLDKAVPNAHKQNAHHLLILHGRYTCIARKPRCQSCVIEDLCEFDGKLIE